MSSNDEAGELDNGIEVAGVKRKNSSSELEKDGNIKMNCNQSVYENTNGMPMAGGKNLHMEIMPGEIASRIITVGSLGRAEKIAAMLDPDFAIFSHTSSRGFTTFTGSYQGVACSIVAIGMGPSMMDFFVRESRAVVSGPMHIIRFGTCGGLVASSPAGSIVVANGSALATRDPDSFAYLYDSELTSQHKGGSSYKKSLVVPSDSQLTTNVIEELTKVLPDKVQSGINITAESFYGSQGRIDPNFIDHNESLISELLDHYPSALTMEMESFQLLHLARCASSSASIKATAAAIVVANRQSALVVDESTLGALEITGGRALLNAIIKM